MRFVLLGACILLSVPVRFLAAADYAVKRGMDPLLFADSFEIFLSEINDTGVDQCADANSNTLTCPQSDYPGQDAEFGTNGFSFTKLDALGNELSDSAATWTCTKDNVTGLVWEIKSISGGLQDLSNSYSWYDTNPATNGGSAGLPNGGSCAGSDCDTEGFVQAINAQNLCGFGDWTLPRREQLRSLVDYGLAFPGPMISTTYFPNTAGARFWSSSASASSSDAAWRIDFASGADNPNMKATSLNVRLVRVAQ